MNAAARTLSQGNLFRGDFSFTIKSTSQMLVLFLWLSVISSALAVIYIKNLERQYVFEVGQTSYENSKLDIEEAQLRLENSMWSAPGRVRGMAKHNLKMSDSKTAAIILIKR